MPVIEKNINLKVSVESVVRYLSDPSHLTEYCRNMIEVSDVERQIPGAGKFTWVYKMMGVRTFGEAEFHETKHNQQLVVRFWGGVQGSLIWQFKPLDTGTLLEVKCDYITPPPLLKKHTEDAILHQNEHAVEHMLINLKTLLGAYHARTLNRV
jgi:uncharacterized protein YndB with AHSA1/START domain